MIRHLPIEVGPEGELPKLLGIAFGLKLETQDVGKFLSTKSKKKKKIMRVEASLISKKKAHS